MPAPQTINLTIPPSPPNPTERNLVACFNLRPTYHYSIYTYLIERKRAEGDGQIEF